MNTRSLGNGPEAPGVIPMPCSTRAPAVVLANLLSYFQGTCNGIGDCAGALVVSRNGEVLLEHGGRAGGYDAGSRAAGT